jgi:hypothetical protein
MSDYDKQKSFAWVYRVTKRLKESSGEQGVWPSCETVDCLELLEQCEWAIAISEEEHK